MILQYRNKKTGEVYEPKKYDGGYRVMLELSNLEDFRRFATIAQSARLVKVGGTSGNVIEFTDLEEII